jgi:hypothetical protein
MINKGKWFYEFEDILYWDGMDESLIDMCAATATSEKWWKILTPWEAFERVWDELLKLMHSGDEGEMT